MNESSRRFLVGLEGTSLRDDERRVYAERPPFGVVLLARNLETAEQTAALVSDIKSLASPAPLLLVDQEGGPVDRLGPLLGHAFPSAAHLAKKGTDRVHTCAYLMGRAARILGFDVALAPCVDLGVPKAAADVLAGRTFGFHAEDVELAGLVFLHGLARAGMGSCLKHFPGLGRATTDTHESRPVIDAHDVDMMVTDVAPFARLHRSADAVMVGHAAYPGFTNDETPASQSPRIHALLRKTLGFEGVVLSGDLQMGSLEGTLPERAQRAAEAGCDLLCVTDIKPGDWPALVRSLEDDQSAAHARQSRLEALRQRCATGSRPAFTRQSWNALADELEIFLTELEAPRQKHEIDFEALR